MKGFDWTFSISYRSLNNLSFTYLEGGHCKGTWMHLKENAIFIMKQILFANMKLSLKLQFWMSYNCLRDISFICLLDDLTFFWLLYLSGNIYRLLYRYIESILQEDCRCKVWKKRKWFGERGSFSKSSNITNLLRFHEILWNLSYKQKPRPFIL